jgi:hypothetical protein
MLRDTLLDKVFQQLEADISCRDFTAIEELLASIPNETLKSYLSEELANA